MREVGQFVFGAEGRWASALMNEAHPSRWLLTGPDKHLTLGKNNTASHWDLIITWSHCHTRPDVWPKIAISHPLSCCTHTHTQTLALNTWVERTHTHPQWDGVSLLLQIWKMHLHLTVTKLWGFILLRPLVQVVKNQVSKVLDCAGHRCTRSFQHTLSTDKKYQWHLAWWEDVGVLSVLVTKHATLWHYTINNLFRALSQ